MKGWKPYIYIVLTLVGFVFGVYAERTTTWHDQEEWMQISKEACDLRIKTLKATCKK